MSAWACTYCGRRWPLHALPPECPDCGNAVYVPTYADTPDPTPTEEETRWPTAQAATDPSDG